MRTPTLKRIRPTALLQLGSIYPFGDFFFLILFFFYFLFFIVMIIVMVSGFWVLGLVLSGIHADGATGQRMRSFLVRGKRVRGRRVLGLIGITESLDESKSGEWY